MRRLLLVVATGLVAAASLLPAVAQARPDAPSPAGADLDGDRLPDRWERRHGLSLRVDQSRRDPDRDGLPNLGEYRAKSDPRERDSDDDGLRDGAEVRFGLSPRDRDSDDDGTGDASEQAGRVVSFEDGVLTIALVGGGTVSGAIAGATGLTCRDTHALLPTARAYSAPRVGPTAGVYSAPPARVAEATETSSGGGACAVADLVPGTLVREATLELAAAVAVFCDVELLR